MGDIWTDRAKYQSWLDVEVAACEANCRLGRVPKDAMQTIREQSAFEPERILEIEAEVRHDVIAFLTNVNEHVGDAGVGVAVMVWVGAGAGNLAAEKHIGDATVHPLSPGEDQLVVQRVPIYMYIYESG